MCDLSKLLSRGWAEGQLRDHGPYTALVAGAARVQVEVHRLLPGDTGGSLSALERLDAWEEFDPQSPQTSLYVRERVWVHGANVTAWIYRAAADLAHLPLIAGGDWREHIARANSVAPASATEAT